MIMKSFKILFIVAVIFSNYSFSQSADNQQVANNQQVSFCKVFDLLVESVASNFEAYKGEAIEKSTGSFQSKLQITGAKKTYITIVLGDCIYTADFGTFSSLAESEKVMNQMKSELKTCKPGYDFMFLKDRILDQQYNHNIIMNHSAGVRLYNAYFNIRLTNGIYYLTFSLYKNDLITEYINLTNEPDQNQILVLISVKLLMLQKPVLKV